MIDLRKWGDITENIPYSKYSFSQALLLGINPGAREFGNSDFFRTRLIYWLGVGVARRNLWP